MHRHMRTWILSIMLLLTGQQVFGQLSTGLIAHWTFNGNANDVTGNGHNGTASNVTYTAGYTGTSNTAAKFNGTNSYVSVPYKSDINLSKFSICAVVQFKGFYTANCQASMILLRGTQYSQGYYFLDICDNYYDSSCAVTGDTSHFKYGIESYNQLTYTKPWNNGPTIHTNTWYCVVATYDGSVYKLYVNGTLQITVPLKSTPSSQIGSSTEGISIGANRFGGSGSFPYWLNGTVDDIRLYNRVLSANEATDYCATIINDTSVYIKQPLNKTSFCPGDTVHVNYGVTLPFKPGNTFTAQLSNASGSFASPVNTGSVNSQTDGTIVCTIPPGTAVGTGYRIRVVASSPLSISASNTVNLTVKGDPNITFNGKTSYCAGDTLSIIATATPAASNYSWTGPASFTGNSQSITIANLTTQNQGDYILTASSGNCTGKDTVTITINPKPVINSVNSNTPVCKGDTLKLFSSVTPINANYNWSGPGTLIGSPQNPVVINTSFADSGTYVLTASANGCFSKDSLKVDIVETPGVTPTVKTPVCSGDTIYLSSNVSTSLANISWTGPNGFTQTTANPTIPLAATIHSGIYYVTATLGNCSDMDSVAVNVIETPQVSINSNTPLCVDDTLKINTTTNTPGASKSWTGPVGFQDTSLNVIIPQIIELQAGTYILTIDNNGCTAADSVDVFVGRAGFDLDDSIRVCDGTPVTISPEVQNGSYKWQDGSTDSKFIAHYSGKYYVTITLGSCSTSDTVNVTVANVRLNLPPDTTFCPGDIVTLAAPDTLDYYMWNTGARTHSIQVNEQGRYYLTAGKWGCEVSDSLNLTLLKPEFTLGPDSNLCQGEAVLLTAGSLPGSTYLWNYGQKDKKYAATQSGEYWVMATNICGTFSDTINLVFEDCRCRPVVPSAFSPNGDGRNDRVGPMLFCNPYLYRFMIFNRWGQMVFSARNMADKWDGTFNGKAQDAGTYYYLIEVAPDSKRREHHKGSITLIR